MKLPIRSVFAALALGLVAAQSTVRAQDAQPPPDQGPPGQGPGQRHPGADMAKRMIHRMKVKLNLTDDQVKQVAALMKGQMEQAKALREDTSLDPDQKMAKLQEMRQSTRSQIRALLTLDQQTIFDTMPERPPHGGPGPGPGGEPPPAPPPQS